MKNGSSSSASTSARGSSVQMEKLSAMGQLLAGVAHEFNNPLTVVSGQAQLLRMMGPPPPVAERAEQIVKATDRCIRIVRNFLGFARRVPAKSNVGGPQHGDRRCG